MQTNQFDLGQVARLKPQVATLSLPEVKINLDEKDPIANISGLQAIIDPQARKDLIKIAGFDAGSLQTIQTTAGVNAANTILRQVMKALGNKKMTFAFDGPRITRIVDPGQKQIALSNLTVAQMCEMVIGKGNQIWGLQISPDQTKANIQILNPRIHEHPTMKNESVTIGRTIQWDALGGTSIADFVQRMYCSNGSTMNEDGKVISILRPDMDPGQMYELLFVEGAEKRLASHFNRILELQEKPMSIREWQSIAAKLGAFAKADSDVIKNHLGFGFGADGKVPFEHEYAKSGHILSEYNQDQLSNCPTPVIWWDAINTLTWLGSHPTNSNVSDWEKGKLLQDAGKMISRSKRDADSWIQGLPIFSN